MIRKATPADTAEVLRRAAPWPVTGVLCGMHWQMLLQNPRLPHVVYLTGHKGLLTVSGGRATLCGPVEDADELGVFLRFAGASQLTALQFVPKGWRLAEENRVMLRPAGLSSPPVPLPANFTAAPSIAEILEVLEESDGPISPPAAREYFICDLQARRNHGMAMVYGIRKNGKTLATAGLWALTQNAGYLACVETRPAHRRRGYASSLVARLCADYSSRSLSLLCKAPLAGFYTPFGFTDTGLLGYISVLDDAD